MKSTADLQPVCLAKFIRKSIDYNERNVGQTKHFLFNNDKDEEGIDLLTVIYHYIGTKNYSRLNNGDDFSKAKQVLLKYKDEELAKTIDNTNLVTCFYAAGGLPFILYEGIKVNSKRKKLIGLNHVDEFEHLNKIEKFCEFLGLEPTVENIISLICEWIIHADSCKSEINDVGYLNTDYRKDFEIEFEWGIGVVTVNLRCATDSNNNVVTLLIRNEELEVLGLANEKHWLRKKRR